MLGNKSFILSLESFAEFPKTGAVKSPTPFINALNFVLIDISGGVIDSL
jgi:hypothetical protein